MKLALKDRLVYKIHDLELAKAAKQFVRGRLLDIGCGTKPYKNLLAPFVVEHVGLDHEKALQNQEIDIIASASNIPVESSSFDSVICTAVLEHLGEPEMALRECFRVLKSGGMAIYSVPFIWPVHDEARDCYRFSKFGLEYLFKKVGFEIVQLKALSGFWFTFGQMLVSNIYRFDRDLLGRLHLIDVIGWFIQYISYLLDKVDKVEHWTMYLVVARKPLKISKQMLFDQKNRNDDKSPVNQAAC